MSVDGFISGVSRELGRDTVTRRRIPVGRWLAGGWLVLMVAAAIVAPLVMGDTTTPHVEDRLLGPGQSGHLFGTDALGRDVLGRALAGARLSLLVASTTVMFSAFLGGALGILAAYRKGAADWIIGAGADVVLSFPHLVLLLALATFLGASVPVLIGGMTLLFVPAFMRIARSSALVVLTKPFIAAARSLGAPPPRILFREVAPNISRSVIAYSLVMFGIAIMVESSLSYLGAGIPPPASTWGNMISDGTAYLDSARWLVLGPSAFLFLTVFSCMVFGDGLRRQGSTSG